MSTQNLYINNQNIVVELQKYVKQFPKEPMYGINYTNDMCLFELLVNDIIIFKEFSYTGNSSLNINQAIFKSGSQRVSFRMYPAEYEEKDTPGKSVFSNIFDKETYLELNPDVYDKTSKGSFSTPIKEYKTPAIPNPVKNVFPDSIFIAAGKDYYEGSFSFEAEIPYQLEGFEKAQDLRKIDKKELETKLLKKYQEVWSIFQNKEYDNIARISFDRLRNNVISFYYTKQEAKDAWETGFSAFSNPTFEMQPIENYELKFFAEGKLVALITKSNDPRLRESSALWGKFKENGKTRAFISKSFFYIPEGETEFKVY